MTNVEQDIKAILSATGCSISVAEYEEAMARASHREQEENKNVNQFDNSMYVD